jgi:hypothetical protein
VKNNDRVGAVKFGDAAGAPTIVSDIERKAVLINLIQILGKRKTEAIKAGHRYEIDDASKRQISIKKQAKIYHGIVACQIDDHGERYENYGSSKQCWMKALALLRNSPRLS